MPNLALVSRVNVLTAIRDHDQEGAAGFLEALGFDGPGDEVVVVRGKRYDARALLAYAHGKATGTALAPEEITTESVQVLRDLDFTLASRAELDRPKSAPAARTRASTARPRAATARKSTARTKAEPVVALCPSCFTQLSVTGVCDFCS